MGNNAICTLAQGLAVELATRIRVNAVASTWKRTPLWKGMSVEDVNATEKHFAEMIPLKRTAKIEEIAPAYFLMQNSFITGHALPVEGGLILVG